MPNVYLSAMVTNVILTYHSLRVILFSMFGDELPNETGAAEIANSDSVHGHSHDPHTVVLFVVLLVIVGIYFFYLAS
jgi:hypothetical protein